ncbi:hypothetical protein AQ490_15605 [Wenjunlia vitaminophila]|uniref:SDR family oxidoreductase n=1 Tax=Wenjunlia vitaminophila TaxID=76728 RepID=A0A0T6LWH3_WENVI|nr:SDR family oxidoreductase [Wenjunlia vitaminophila]KRV50503.1 hypothetical protein AQ490_15605 [Wenjunlia vitaminophila]
MSEWNTGRRVAVLTGADSGVGRATALRLAREDVDIGLTWQADAESIERTAEEVRRTGRLVAVEQLDPTRLPEAAQVVDRLADSLGRVDILVNHASTVATALFLDVTLDRVREVIDADLIAPFLCGQRAAHRMIAQGRGGRIINVTSVHEHAPLVGGAPYCAAKGGLRLLTQVMALELSEYGITVNSVAPGEITSLTPREEEATARPMARPGIPLGRAGDAHEVAALITFLASEEAGYITGASYVVDGGMLHMGPHAGQQLRDSVWRLP